MPAIGIPNKPPIKPAINVAITNAAPKGTPSINIKRADVYDFARHKILSFAIGSAFAGLGGALYASYMTVISPGDFGFMRSIEMYMHQY